MESYRFWIRILPSSERHTGFASLSFADGGERDEGTARDEARTFSRRYRLRAVVADWEGPRFYYDVGKPVDMIEGMTWFVPPVKPVSAPARPKFSDHATLTVFLDLTLDEGRYRESLRRLDKGGKSLIAYVRALHRNPHAPGTWLHAHHEEYNRLPTGVDWNDLATQLRALHIHTDLGVYDPTLPRRTPEERAVFARRIRELVPEYDRDFHLGDG